MPWKHSKKDWLLLFLSAGAFAFFTMRSEIGYDSGLAIVFTFLEDAYECVGSHFSATEVEQLRKEREDKKKAEKKAAEKAKKEAAKLAAEMEKVKKAS